MNKETERVTYEEFMTMFKFAPRMCYTLYDKAEDEIDQLTNNWNELEEIIRKDHEECKNIYDNFEKSITIYTKTLLDKMKEIKEGNNVSSRD